MMIFARVRHIGRKTIAVVHCISKKKKIMENKELSLSQKFVCNFEYSKEVDERIHDVTMLIEEILSNNSRFKNKYPNSKCWVGFIKFDVVKKELVFLVMAEEMITNGESFFIPIGKLNLNNDNIDNDEELTKEINAWFADFLEKELTIENEKIESNG